MDWDDIIYLLLLFISIICGYFYRKISDPEHKKITGTTIGLAIIIIVSGLHILHTIIFTVVNCLIILLINKRKCHIVSFVYSFTYLFFFRTTIYFGIPYPPAHTNLVIMILTLKLVGLAFEVNTSYMRKISERNDVDEELLNEYDCTDINPSFMDIVHYAFNYVAVLTGPYYSYRSYWDSIYMPYSKYANCQAATLEKLTFVPLYAGLFLWATYTWPLAYALSDEFYLERSWLYRLWYVVPIFFIFRMRIYIGIILSECVCTMAGVGAYPKSVYPKPGRGPSSNFSSLKKLGQNENILATEEFNFETIHNIEPYETEVCTTFREGMKHWNMCVQYWMAVNVYKRFPNKKLRTIVTLFVSAVWHGVYIGHYFCIGGAPFYLAVEDIFINLFLKDKEKSGKLWSWILWVSKMYAFSYLAMAFQLLTIPKVMHFYNSIYHFGTVSTILLFVVGTVIAQSRKVKRTTDAVDQNNIEKTN